MKPSGYYLTYHMADKLRDELTIQCGRRKAQWYDAHWRQWVERGSIVNVYPDSRPKSKLPRKFTPEQLAKLDEFLGNLATIIPELLPIEPDGVQGYEYTIEARYGVPVGEDWLPVAMRHKVTVSLFHPAMLCEAA